MSEEKREEEKKNVNVDFNLGGVFSALSGIVEKLGDLAQTGEDLKKSGEFTAGQKDEFKGVYGFTVKVGGLGGDGPKVEPFGNIARDRESGKTVVREVREPVVDVFEEEDHTLIVAELPGISEEDLKIEMNGDVLILTAEKGTKKYRKEVVLGSVFTEDQVSSTCNNGVVELRCRKTASTGE